jgi:hypothetical protein
MTVSMSWPQYCRRQCSVVRTLAPLQAELLALLLLSPPGQFLAVEEIVEGLWPDADHQPLTASRLTQHAIFELRELGVPIEGRTRNGGWACKNRWQSHYAGYRVPLEARAH